MWRENDLANQERNTKANVLFIAEQRIRTNICGSICNIPCCVYTLLLLELFPALELGNASWHRCKVT
jgi:hypothetical protein